MVRGFYNIGSGILVNQKKLSNISNNIANVETTGYKKQTLVQETFANMVIEKWEKGNHTPIGEMNLSTVIGDTYTIHSQGSIKSTGNNLDFALQGSGFFAVQSESGILFTRNGNFSVDEAGYLVQGDIGRVLGADGQPIKVNTDDVTADSDGNILVNGEKAGQLGIFDFNDYSVLRKANQGYYSATGNANLIAGTVKWQSLEASNVDYAEEITNAISTQRELQSQVQILKMYDGILEKAATELSKIN